MNEEDKIRRFFLEDALPIARYQSFCKRAHDIAFSLVDTDGGVQLCLRKLRDSVDQGQIFYDQELPLLRANYGREVSLTTKERAIMAHCAAHRGSIHRYSDAAISLIVHRLPHHTYLLEVLANANIW